MSAIRISAKNMNFLWGIYLQNAKSYRDGQISIQQLSLVNRPLLDLIVDEQVRGEKLAMDDLRRIQAAGEAVYAESQFNRILNNLSQLGIASDQSRQQKTWNINLRGRIISCVDSGPVISCN
jgi:hypothetical protein